MVPAGDAERRGKVLSSVQYKGKEAESIVGDRNRVVIADDQYVARGFFEMYVKMSVDFELAASLATAEQAVEYCRNHPVELVIMDVVMKQGLDGLTCAETIKNNNRDIKIILATSNMEYRWIEKAKKAGIESFWFKEYDENSLLEVMDKTMKGISVYPGVASDAEAGHAKSHGFSEQELEILGELTANRSNEEIAEKYRIPVDRVQDHIQSMLLKTGFANRLELAVNAKNLGAPLREDERRGI